MKARKLTKETIREVGIKKNNYPAFNVGDTIIVATRVSEGNKERIQKFQGDVIAKKNNGVSSTFTVRKIGANSVAVERIFPENSPIIDSITVVKHGKVRRAKLYYLRDRLGKSARIKEDITKRHTASATQSASEEVVETQSEEIVQEADEATESSES